MTAIDRRSFLSRTAALAGAGLLGGTAIGRLSARAALAAAGAPLSTAAPYGPLVRMTDQRGVHVLALPEGFSYVTFSRVGETMADGNPVPRNLDGMAAFAHDGLVRLVRNHEDRNGPGLGTVGGPEATRYDPAAGGGTVTMDFDPVSGTLVRDFVSLNGTIVNCSGGRGWRRRSWLTCEETTDTAASDGTGWTRDHGYVFSTPLATEPGHPAAAVPYPAMGRFCHEAAAVDQRTGIVYLTEDSGAGEAGDADPKGASGFYRFLPEDPRDYAAGGRLQMLAVAGRPQYDTRKGQQAGRRLRAAWVDVADPDPRAAGEASSDKVVAQGWRAGGAVFNRLEGCWIEGPSLYFSSSSGGDAENGDVDGDGYREGFGQIWRYRPARDDLTLYFESPGVDVLDSPDNLCVTPRRGLLVCEDDAGSALEDTHPLVPWLEDVNRLVGFTPAGEAFEFAVNTLNRSELSGACFSPDGTVLFVNLFGTGDVDTPGNPGSGMTCAITGPWSAGPL